MEVKEAPVRGVRAVVSRLFGGKGKDRAKADKVTAAAPDVSHVKVIETDAPETEAPATEAPTTETPATEATSTEAVVTEAVVVEAVVTEEAPEVAAAEAEAPEAEAAPAEAPATNEGNEAAGAELPLANYDTLTVASLRARLRTLSVDDLVILITYEKAHEGREEVVGMFERRKAKIIAGETSSFQAVK
jgi:hypothetical protein